MKPIAYQTRVIISGNVIEKYYYEIPIVRNLTGKKGVSAPKISPGELGEAMEDIESKKLAYRGKSNIRARNEIRRLALSNFDSKSKFLTLTFKDNVTDLEVANELFKKFTRKLRGKYPNFKYIAVIEFQKRGAIHYHMLLDIPYVKAKQLRDMWGQGNVKINKIDHVNNVGAYIVKYMTKAKADERLIGKKMYQCSRNLERPIEIIGESAEQYLADILDPKKKPTYTNEYLHKQTESKVTYEEYNFNISNECLATN